MPQTITLGYKALLTAAEAEVRTLDVEAVKALLGRDDVVLVDLRDPRELEREGRMPGAFHCPRGMLEFWIDPESPYAKPGVSTGQTVCFLLRGRLAFGFGRKNRARYGIETCCSYARRI